MTTGSASRGINPITFAQQVNREFLEYQFTAFPLTDPELAAQARARLMGEMHTSPLIQGPYVSLSHSFEPGADLRDLARNGAVHLALPGLTDHPMLFKHQELALRALQDQQHALIATGTGSGKTEAFLYPILDHCLRLRDSGAPEGVVALLVYPMNALALDQLSRLRHMLVGSGISFGLYVGSVATTDDDAALMRPAPANTTRAEFDRLVMQREREEIIICPEEERRSEQSIAARPPRILLTNVNQLELLLTRGRDLRLFTNAPLRYIVFDEAHTYSGARGAEVACLIRRVRAFCGKTADEVLCVGTSATVGGNEHVGEDPARGFAHRFFGVDPARVAIIREQYLPHPTPADGQMQAAPPRPSADTLALLDEVLDLLAGEVDVGRLRSLVLTLTGSIWPHAGRGERAGSTWRRDLFDHLCANPYIATLFDQLRQPKYLPEVVQNIATILGRAAAAVVGERDQAELLGYLALGAVAEAEGVPLLRPKVHYFVRGLDGAAISFTAEGRPLFALSRAEALNDAGVAFDIFVCRNCGQHYLETWLEQVEWDAHGLAGGLAEGNTIVWQVGNSGTKEAARVLFTNSLLRDEEHEGGSSTKHQQLAYLCRHCGALHRHPGACQAPKCRRADALIAIIIPLAQSAGKLDRCLACGQRGSHSADRHTESIRPLRASTVADVHILTQNMLNAAPTDHQKLIVFSDNRQDAAFQAGWMQDHARRYRIRHLIYQHLGAMPRALGDLVEDLFKDLKADPDIARALAPEVFANRVEEDFGETLDTELRRYLRILLLREIVTGFKQRDGLEIWGKLRVIYNGVASADPFVQHWAVQLGIDSQTLAEGIATLLDAYRRTRYLYDQSENIFSRWWREGDDEIQRGYLPFWDMPPKGLKEFREAGDKEAYTTQFRSNQGQTLAMGFIKKWPIPPAQAGPFMEALWHYLAEELALLKPVVLVGSGGRAIAGATGARQIDTARIGIILQSVRYRCTTCQRIHSRPTPGAVCSAHHCQGHVVEEVPPAEDYNISRLDHPFTLVRAHEHSAQVPPKVREELEREFKRSSGRYNCLVATPTLEMGVDIGALDMILLRNAPPRPTNYWQRIGRAGRRFQMAVAYTYCRRSDHDRYFFEDPLRMLDGQIDVPRFNLQNAVMLRKHIHAAVLSELIRSEYGAATLDAAAVAQIHAAREAVFPTYIRSLLFLPDKSYRPHPFDVAPLRTVLTAQRTYLLDAIARIFAEYWPAADRAVVAPARLAEVLDSMADRLQAVVNTLFARMEWARATQKRLTTLHDQRAPEPEEVVLLNRCRSFLRKLGEEQLGTYTLTLLALEGFLPGYGTYEPGIIAYAGRNMAPLRATERREFQLTRAPAMAVREYVPGNMVYANSARFKTTLYHLPIAESTTSVERYHVIPRQQIVRSASTDATSYGGHAQGSELPGLPICDVDLAYVARISDEEENRFQLPVVVLGMLRDGHRGGNAYATGTQEIQQRFAQQIRLVNIGPVDRVEQSLGYPICGICGATRSPYAKEEELKKFIERHTSQCGRAPTSYCVTTDTTVDGCLFTQLSSLAQAINLGEAINLGASRVLEMDLDDLQTLILPRDEQHCDLLLYDPMPGGSGLLQQILDTWETVIAAALAATQECPRHCETSCYACMSHYRNTWYHRTLNRHDAARWLLLLTEPLQGRHAIPPIESLSATAPAGSAGQNAGEARLGAMLHAAGMTTFRPQVTIPLAGHLRQTTPDYFFEDPVRTIRVAIYLDGPEHDLPERKRMDRFIRAQLEEQLIEVIDIRVEDLDDAVMMQRHLRKIARRCQET